MFTKRRRHQVPGLNTTSTADISFMLLIFFLVTTNMDVDKGLTRQLPPAEKQEQQTSQVMKGTMMHVVITPDNVLLVDGKPTPISRMCGLTEDFVRRVGKKHLIKIEASPVADYDVYFQLQNQLVMAYSRLRNDVAVKTYGKAYAKLTDVQREHVKELCPQRIAEDNAVSSPSRTGENSNTASAAANGKEEPT